MFKKLTIAAALFIVGATLTPSPAQALPGPGEYLTVRAFYADAGHTQLIGQAWNGCGQPAGSWGATKSVYRELFFTPCS